MDRSGDKDPRTKAKRERMKALLARASVGAGAVAALGALLAAGPKLPPGDGD